MFSLETLFLLLFSLFLCYLLWRKNGNYWKERNVPYETPLPFVGNMLDILLFRKNIGFKMKDFYFNHINEKYFGMWIFNVPHLVINSPDLIKQIMVKDFKYFYDRNVACEEKIDGLSANMMFFMQNPKWKMIRENTTLMLSSGKMKYIYPKIQNIAKNMMQYMDSKRSSLLETRSLTTKFATEVICSSAFGIDAHSFQDKDTPFTHAGKVVFGITLENAIAGATYFCKSSLVKLLNIKFINSKIADFFTDTFLEIVKQREDSNSERRDLVDIIIKFKTEHQLNDQELVAQAAQFFLAGYETTSSTITHALYELALHKDIQAKLRDEINDNIDDDGNISYENLFNMVYMEKVMSETLRKYPIVLFLGRSCTEDYKIPDSDLTIEKDTAIIIPLSGLHYDPRYFPNPEEFDPERFTQENVKARHPYTYLPFGEGPRNCIGKRMAQLSVKLALAHIIKNFDVEMSPKTDVPLKFSAKSFTLHLENGVYLNFNKIN